MPIQDDYYDPDYRLPLALDDQIEFEGIGNARSGAVSRFFKATLLIAVATATAVAALSVKDPVALVADVTASLIGSSAPQPATDQPAPVIQSAANVPDPAKSSAEALPPATMDVPKSDEIAASQPAVTAQADQSGPVSDALFRQFQAWAADQDAHPAVTQPVQDAPAKAAESAPAQVADDARPPRRLIQRHRQVRAVRDAEAQLRTQRVRRVQSARVDHPARAERPPIQDARAQDVPAQNAQAPSSFLSTFGSRN
jgi:hypothetical protein